MERVPLGVNQVLAKTGITHATKRLKIQRNLLTMRKARGHKGGWGRNVGRTELQAHGLEMGRRGLYGLK